MRLSWVSYAEWFSKLSYLYKYKDSTPRNTNGYIHVQIQRLHSKKYKWKNYVKHFLALLGQLWVILGHLEALDRVEDVESLRPSENMEISVKWIPPSKPTFCNFHFHFLFRCIKSHFLTMIVSNNNCCFTSKGRLAKLLTAPIGRRPQQQQ